MLRTKNSKITGVLLSFLLLCIALAYTSSIHGELTFDDEHTIEKNILIKDREHFRTINWLDQILRGSRVVTNYSFAINYSIGRLDVLGYHAANMLIHLCVVLLVFFFTRKTLRLAGYQRPEYRALIIAGIFGLHPLQSQPVSYICQRAEILSSLFYLSSFMLFLKTRELGFNWRGIGTYLLGFIAFAIGLGSKEIVVTLPLAYILYDYYFHPEEITIGSDIRPKKSYASIGKRLALPLPLLIFGTIYAVMTVSSFRASPDIGFQNVEGITPIQYLLTEFRVLFTYLRLLALPVNQNLDYDYPLSSGFFEPKTFFSIVFLFIVFLFAVYLIALSRRARNRRSDNEFPGLVISYGVLWFLLILIPTSSIVPIVDVIFEHRTYLASWGIITAVVTIGDAAYYKSGIAQKRKGRIISVVALLLLLTALGTMLFERNKVWKNNLTLWSDVAAKSPNKARARMNLGFALSLEGEYEAAIREYRYALKLLNDRSVSQSEILRNLGFAFFKLGQLNKAIDTFREALTYDPLNEDILNNLAVCLIETEQYEEALNYAQKALRANPSHGYAQNTLGEIYFRKEEYQKAAEYFQQAIFLNPDIPARYYNLALSLEKLGRTQDACRSWNQYLAIAGNEEETEEVLTHIREHGCN